MHFNTIYVTFVGPIGYTERGGESVFQTLKRFKTIFPNDKILCKNGSIICEKPKHLSLQINVKCESFKE